MAIHKLEFNKKGSPRLSAGSLADTCRNDGELPQSWSPVIVDQLVIETGALKEDIIRVILQVPHDILKQKPSFAFPVLYENSARKPTALAMG